LEILGEEHGELKVQHQNLQEKYEKTNEELEDTVRKLHITNKVRHETEIKIGEAHEREKDHLETIRERDMWLTQKNRALEDLEKQLANVEKERETLEIKKIALDRTVESNRKILTDKIDNYKQVIEGE